MCHRESVQNSKERLEVGKEAETSARLCQYYRKQYLTWESTAFSGVLHSALFCTVLVLLIIHVQHCCSSTQQHSVTKLGVFRYEPYSWSWKPPWEQNKDLSADLNRRICLCPSVHSALELS